MAGEKIVLDRVRSRSYDERHLLPLELVLLLPVVLLAPLLVLVNGRGDLLQHPENPRLHAVHWKWRGLSSLIWDEWYRCFPEGGHRNGPQCCCLSLYVHCCIRSHVLTQTLHWYVSETSILLIVYTNNRWISLLKSGRNILFEYSFWNKICIFNP